MHFGRRHPEDEPEINLVPFIDVLLVILIFLMLTTTYARFTELKITLPVANAQASTPLPRQLGITISAEGRYALDNRPVDGSSVERLAAEILSATGNNDKTVLVISADAATPHQYVINAMDAARRAGITRLTFAAQHSWAGGTDR
jgi:biopolymer transport protein ExbD